MTKKFFLTPIKAYQYFSKLMPGKCRYYPTCSEYAKWQFETTDPLSASLNSTLRILRCNQLFAGGIDYPIIKYTPPNFSLKPNINKNYGKIDIKYWFVPKDQRHYYVLKDFDWK
ncbi:MAG: membrane protein insertion efficiency factor YidD [Epsilonproteobacteria bacterium]|nr:membrane protein insertion efficiency factor YidD [Campylobacterota bacterium]